MKKNKIFKALGVGALATIGLFTVTGCSLSDSEKTKIMSGINNANDYMEKHIDVLKDQNYKLAQQIEELKKQNELLSQQNKTSSDDLTESKLTNTTLTAYLEELKKQIAVLKSSLEAEQNENDILQDYLEELQQENAKITTDEAYNKLMLAKAKLESNKDGIRNNLRVICVATDGEYEQYQIVELYKTGNNGYVSNVVFDDYRGISSNFCYEYEDNVYEYEKDLDAEGNIADYTKIIRSDFLSSESGSGLTYAMTPLFLDKLLAENIYSVEILENGNYKISAIIESEIKRENEDYYNKQIYVLEYEITSDCKFVSMNLNQFIEGKEEVEGGETEKQIQTISGGIVIEYNTITEEYINQLLEEAISKDLKAAE